MLCAPKLKAVMAERGETQSSLAKKIKMTQQTLSSRMNGKSCFNLDEIDAICSVLQITDGQTKEAIFLA